MKTLLDQMIFHMIVLFSRTVGLVPRKAGARLGTVLGRRLYHWDKRHASIAIENLTEAYAGEKNPKEIEAIARRVFQNLGKVIFEICWSLSHDKKNQFRHFTIEGLSNIQKAYDQGRGVLGLTAHFGNWELLTVIGAMLKYPSSIVYRPLDFRPMERFMVLFRTRFGAKMIPKKKAFRNILKSLDRKEMVALLMDQNVAWREGVFADFFGRPACTNKGMALLALKTGAPVIPAFLIRNQSGFTAKFLPEIPLIKTGDKVKDLEANTAQYNRVIESIVRQYPDQWFWVHRRWNTRPFYPWPREN